eukprot:TRINITY_DN12230_c0_g1_i1.p1 TRINITY_DN12230_c0_g1~~TRINITY_DN12230_c0_g1_i1.p1  ORF type:complete len:113 (-),score=21.59 TRINITY_DN12230_c0_g1_i1:128-466(-)
MNHSSTIPDDNQQAHPTEAIGERDARTEDKTQLDTTIAVSVTQSTPTTSFGLLGEDSFSLHTIATSLHTVKKQQKLEYERAFNEEYGDELTYLINKIEFSNQDKLDYMPYIS